MMPQTDCDPGLESDESSIFTSESATDDSELSDWHERIFDDITEVAELLDCLEVWAVDERKLYTIGQGLFLVRWCA